MEKTNEQSSKELNKFLRSIHMGTKTFKVYKDKAKDQTLVELINDTLDTFKKHEIKITKLVKSYGITPIDDISLGNEFVVMMEKVKTPRDDFEIGISALKAINMGLTNGIEFIHENCELDNTAKTDLKEVVDDYSHLMNKYNDHLQTYC